MEMEIMGDNFLQYLSADEMMPLVGAFGKYHWLLEVSLCVMMLPQAFQLLIMYFAALEPPWRCVANSSICVFIGTLSGKNDSRCRMSRSEWEFVEPTEYSVVTTFDLYCESEWLIRLSTSAFFIGWIFGALFLGWYSDRYGRKTVLFPSTGILIIAGFILPFLPSINLFIICRFIIGFFQPGTCVQAFILLLEVVGGRHRAKAGIILWLAFTVAACLIGMKAYFIRQWKTLFLVCTAPYIILLTLIKFVPESVRWLQLHGKTDDAIDIFRNIAVRNKKRIPANVRLLPISEESLKLKSNLCYIFRTRRRIFSFVIQGFSWFTITIVYYGLSLATYDLGRSMYRNYLLVCLIEFPAHIIAIDICERFGRKKCVVSTLLAGGIICVMLASIPSEGCANIVRYFLGMFGKLSITICFDCICVWSIESYPTAIRSSGIGFMLVASGVGAATAPWLAGILKTVHESVPFILMSVLSFLAVGLLYYLPETKGISTIDISYDIGVVLSDGVTCRMVTRKERVDKEELSDAETEKTTLV